MMQLSRMADYGVVLTTHMAARPDVALHTAPALAEATQLGEATVSKLLKMLTRAGLVASTRGAAGGYSLARPAHTITTADIVEAIDGPIALTRCVDGAITSCCLQGICTSRPHWQRINTAVRAALASVTLADLSADMATATPLTTRKAG